MEELLKEIMNLLNSKKSFALATIITKDHSTPRGPGSKMIIKADGSIFGTIGGGLLEAEVMVSARTVIDTRRPIIRPFALKQKDFTSIDMTCGGELEVLIDYVDSNDNESVKFYQTAFNQLESKKATCIVTLIPDEKKSKHMDRMGIIDHNHAYIYRPKIDFPPDIEMKTDKTYQILEATSGQRLIIEQIRSPYRVYIFGAGHVGLQVHKLSKFIGLGTVIIDDRAEFANENRFKDVKECIICDDYNSVFNHLKVDKNSFVIIVTRGHRHDRTVLEGALKTSAGYIGMIGSKSKVQAIYQELLENGFTEAALKRVHSPIGFSIGAETPEEIAVSIIAEMIQEKKVMENA